VAWINEPLKQDEKVKMVVSNLVVPLDLKIPELALAEDIVLEYPET